MGPAGEGRLGRGPTNMLSTGYEALQQERVTATAARREADRRAGLPGRVEFRLSAAGRSAAERFMRHRDPLLRESGGGVRVPARRRLLRSLALAGVTGCAVPPTAAPPPADGAAAIASALEAVPADGLPGLERSVWIGFADSGVTGGAPLYAEAAETPRPAASSIKTSYLVELFAEYAGTLDEPLPGAASVVDDPEHPAIAHFDAATRAEIREHLTAATVRTVGRHMIRGDDVSNAVYNAAANLTTALLGGPRALTGRIHERHPDFAGIEARRYMLAAREVTGDNEATAASLAAVLAAIAAGTTPGLSAGTHEAMREILFSGETPDGRAYTKGGSLNSEPITRVLSGYTRLPGDSPGREPVWVFMGEVPGAGDEEPAAVGSRLADYLAALRAAALPPAREWLRTQPSGETPAR